MQNTHGMTLWHEHCTHTAQKAQQNTERPSDGFPLLLKSLDDPSDMTQVWYDVPGSAKYFTSSAYTE